MDREGVIQALVNKGKTREQAIAVLDLIGSAFRRRGWAEGEPLTQDQIGERLDTFVGEPEQSSPLSSTTDKDRND
jgi:hypothetical protein